MSRWCYLSAGVFAFHALPGTSGSSPSDMSHHHLSPETADEKKKKVSHQVRYIKATAKGTEII